MSVVYFLQMGIEGPIKIGTARNLKKRMAALSTPDPLQVLATIEGGREIEQQIHKALAKYRRRQEWFENVAEVRAVCSLAKLKGADAILRWLERARRQPTFTAQPPATDDLNSDLLAFSAWGVREVVRIHGMDRAKAVTGKQWDTINAAMKGRLDIRFTDLTALIALEPEAFRPLFARVNCSLIEAGEAIDAYRGKAA